MALVPGQDFTVETKHGIIRCLPKTAAAASAFKVIQLALAKLLPQLPDAPAVDIEIDGVIGPSVTLAVQVIAQRLASGKHQGLAQLSGLQPEQAVPAVAEYAMEVAGYIEQVIGADPTALVNPQMFGEPIDPMAQLKGLFTGKRVAAAAATLLGIGALALVGVTTHRRALGVADRSTMLPPSDGTDEFDEDGDDGSDTFDYTSPEHDVSEIDVSNAIDVEATEVASSAA